MKCKHCCHSGRLLFTLYKEYLCEDCWEDYLNTQEGKIEYFIDVVNRIEPVSAFDADLLGEAAISWNKNKHKLGLSEKTIEEIEIRAISLGLL
jgi:hypothetical protein